MIPLIIFHLVITILPVLSNPIVLPSPGTYTSRHLLQATIDQTPHFISSGPSHSCALLSSTGESLCWGLENTSSSSSSAYSTTPVPVSTQTPNLAIFSTLAFPLGSSSHSCALKSDGSAWCWGGSNEYGQLGSGTFTSTSTIDGTPVVAVTGGLYFTQISCGLHSTCAIEASRRDLYCWGSNSQGQLGQGYPQDQPFPVQTSGGFAWKQVAVGMGGSSVCGLDMNGVMWCWGMIKLNGNMKVDGATFGTLAWVPEIVSSTSGGDGGTTNQVYSRVSVGGDGVVCALLATDGQAMCFGSGDKGQNGDGTTEKRTTPVLVQAGNSFSQISCGQTHVCGLLLNGGQAACWGGNEYGQLGDGTTEDKSSPVAVKGGMSFSRIACGDRYTCAVVEGTGEGMCWGGNKVGQLGDGSTVDQTEPVLVQGGYSYGSLDPGGGVGGGGGGGGNSSGSNNNTSTASGDDGVGVIVGGVIGGIIALTVVIAIAVVGIQRRRRRQTTTNGVKMLQSSSSSGMMNSKSPLTDGSSSDGDDCIKSATHRDVIRADPVLMWATTQAASASVLASQQQGKIVIAAAAAAAPAAECDAIDTSTTNNNSNNDSNNDNNSAKQEKDVKSSTKTTSGGGINNIITVGHGHGCLEINFLDLNIIEKLGEGGFGAVYRAIYNQTKVAAKVLMSRSYDGGYTSINSNTTNTAATVQKKVDHRLLVELEKEAGLMSSPAMRHRNIIQIIGVSLHPPTIITDYCERGSLMDTLYLIKMNNIPLPWPLRLNMMLGAARGMLHLHTRSPPIIHRDLKSPNLLVTQHWEVKIADFNLSKLLPENTASTSTTMNNNNNTSTNAKSLEGGPDNPRWLAPECLMGLKATAAADVFAFGIVMNEMLMCELPWCGVPGLKIVSQVLVGERPKFVHGYICGLSSNDDDDSGSGNGDASPPPPPPPPPTLPPGYEEYVGLMKQCWAQSQKERPDFNTITSVLSRLHEQAMPTVGGGGGGRGSGVAAMGGERKE